MYHKLELHLRNINKKLLRISLPLTLAILTLALLLLTVQQARIVRAATTLVAGDIVVIGMSGDTTPSGGGTGKSFTFVPLVPLEAGTVISFTDSGWLGSSFRASEGGAIYTVPAGGIAAGTVISATGTTNVTWIANGPEWSAPPAGVGNNGMNFSTSGDQVLVFTGNSSAPTFLFAVNGASTIFSLPINADDSNRTALPTGLTEGANAVAVGSGSGDEDEFDNIYYNGITSGTRAEILAAVTNPANWVGNNSSYIPINTNFTISDGEAPATSLTKTADPTDVVSGNLVTYTLTLSNAGTVDDTVILTDPLVAENDFAGWIVQPTGAVNNADQIEWTGTVTAGETVTFTFQVTNTADSGTITNTAEFSGLVDSGTAEANYTVAAATDALIITEIMYNPNSDEDDWEWVEIYNAGDSTIDLSGYVIDDNNGTAHGSANIAGGSVPAGQSAVLYNADDVSAADFLAAWGNVNLIAVTNWNAMSLNNGGDSIGIWGSFASYSGDNQTQANVIEQVVYTDDPPWPADDGSASIYLTNLAADNTNGSNWALSSDGATTPLFNAYIATNAGGNSGSDIGSPGVPAALVCGPGQELVAGVNFDDVTTGLLSGFDPATDNQDGGGGDFFGVGSRNTWPQVTGIPFSVGDDTVFDYSGGGVFAGDTEGIFGQNSDLDNNYFALSDSDEFGAGQTANWSFNVSGYNNLELRIDMGGIADGTSFDGYGPQTVTFTTSIDAGSAQTAFSLASFAPTGFSYRPMDGGASTAVVNVLEVSGDNSVTKYLAEDGSAATNTYLDKTPPSGAGAGEMDTFATAINGSGATMDVSLSADFPFEAMAFDNLYICGTPGAPTPLLILSKTASPTTYVAATELVTYTLILSNTGLAEETNALLTDTLPAEVDFAYWINQDTASVANDEITWSGSLAADAQVTISFAVTSNATIGNVVNTAEFSGTVNSGSDQAIFSTPPAFVKIHEVQGSGLSVTNPNTEVTVEGVVVGDYQGLTELRGFFLQEEDSDVDGNPDTSEGIFVYCNDCPVDVSEGQIVKVTGLQEEFFNMSQIDVAAAPNGNITITNAGNNLNLITPASIDLPAPASTAAEGTFERFEGMWVQFVDDLTATEYFEMARYGQIVLSEGGKLDQFTNLNLPDATGYANYLADIAKRRIILDDLNNSQNSTDPVYHPQPGGFAVDNFIRGGYTVSNLTGVMHWSFAGQSGTDAWRIRPQISNPVSFNAATSRQATPTDVGGDLKIATLNVLNYFTTIDLTSSNDVGDCSPSGTLDCRGADSDAELVRQTQKLTTALQAINADIFALVELENNAAAAPAGDGTDPVLENIVDALNDVVGAGTYDFVDAGTIGGDAIKVGFIYKTTTVALSGSFAVLDSNDFVDPNNIGPKNRPALAQTFTELSSGEKFTAVVNHLKSKGSGCGAGDDDTTTGQGNCNDTRTKAAQKLVDWLATDPTSSSDPDFMILGDLNAYAMEDPVQALKVGADDTANTADDFINLILQFNGPEAYSFVFDGQWGYLDHALANASMAAQVSGLTEWHINSDEVNLLDYNDDIQDAGEASFEVKPGANPLYAVDQYRVSDHDPVIVGLSLGASEPEAKLTVVKQSSISAAYDFTSTIPGYEQFSLTPNGPNDRVMAMVAGGTYTISEVAESFPQNVILIGGSCVDANANNAPVEIDLSYDPPRIVVSVETGQDVVCTFLNEPTTAEDDDGGDVTEGGDHQIYLPLIFR